MVLKESTNNHVTMKLKITKTAIKITRKTEGNECTFVNRIEIREMGYD